MIAIITDSTCDIPKPLLKQYGITVIPTMVLWSGRQYRDRIDLQPEEFYWRLAPDGERPSSSTPSQADFERAYAAAVERGAEALVVLTVSSAMSGVYQLALHSASAVKVPVTVIDSKGPTMSLGWQVLAAARARDEGGDVSAIACAAQRVREGLMQLVYMESLEYLQRGGRIGQAVKWLGVALHVKPVVSINHESGLVQPLGLARTRKGGVEMMYNNFVSFMQGKPNAHVAVLHGNAPEEAEALAERIRADLNPAELLVNITGPVLGIHTGPWALALCGYAEAQ